MNAAEHRLFHQLYEGKWFVRLEDELPVALIDTKTNASNTVDIPVYNRLVAQGYVTQERIEHSINAWPECALKGYSSMFCKLPDSAWKNVCTTNAKLERKLHFYKQEYEKQMPMATSQEKMMGFLEGIRLGHTIAMQHLQKEMQYWYDAQISSPKP